MNIARGLVRNFNTKRNEDLLNLVRQLGKEGGKPSKVDRIQKLIDKEEFSKIDTKVYMPGDAGYDALMRAALKVENDPENTSLVGSHAAKAKKPK